MATGPISVRPAVAVQPNGDAYAVWDRLGGTPTAVIEASRYVAATDSWDAPITLAGPGYFAFPEVAVDRFRERILPDHCRDCTLPDSSRALRSGLGDNEHNDAFLKRSRCRAGRGQCCRQCHGAVGRGHWHPRLPVRYRLSHVVQSRENLGRGCSISAAGDRPSE